MGYPLQRQLCGAELDEVKAMLQLGVKVKYLLKHLHSIGHTSIGAKDIHNVRLKMRKELNDCELGLSTSYVSRTRDEQCP